MKQTAFCIRCQTPVSPIHPSFGARLLEVLAWGAIILAVLFSGVLLPIALPFLECMIPKNVRAAAGVGAGGVPRRMVFVYTPNGMDMENWTPKNFGTNFDLPSILDPLSPLRGNFSVLNGLAHGNARARVVSLQLFAVSLRRDL